MSTPTRTAAGPGVTPGPDAVPMGARVLVTGVVQGVGFRPFVWRLATELGLAGRVRNVAGRVELEAAGTPAALDALTRRLATDAPPRSRVDGVSASPVTDTTWARGLPRPFRIEESDATSTGAVERHFPPDLATCPACLADLADPADRRHGYAFTNCTDCGPRASIIDDLPYDRAATTMVEFAMCAACAAEYTDPADRRFHAEPVACPACGPRVTYRNASGDADRSDPIAAAAADLLAGRIVAVKGLGRVPPGLRRDRRGGGRSASGTQAPLGQAVRDHGRGPRRGA